MASHRSIISLLEVNINITTRPTARAPFPLPTRLWPITRSRSCVALHCRTNQEWRKLCASVNEPIRALLRQSVSTATISYIGLVNLDITAIQDKHNSIQHSVIEDFKVICQVIHSDATEQWRVTYGRPGGRDDHCGVHFSPWCVLPFTAGDPCVNQLPACRVLTNTARGGSWLARNFIDLMTQVEEEGENPGHPSETSNQPVHSAI